MRCLLLTFIFPILSFGQNCDEAQGSPGFPSDPGCEASVCADDSWCCNNEWDGICAGLAASDPDCVGCLTAPCSISGITTGAQTACDPTTNEYTQEITVSYINPPASGNLVVNGQSFAITSSPQTVTLTGLTSDGANVNVTANFSANTGCSLTSNNLFTAPTACIYTIDQGGEVYTCSGDFYDTGGPSGDYGDGESYTMTFCSDQPGEEIVFDFTSFNLESCCDGLVIYDGPDNLSPQVPGSPFFSTSPGTVVSTSGCLTFFFDSDGSVTDPGWYAIISCVIPCDISSVTAGTQTACDPQTDEYTQDVTVTYSNAPASGNLVVNGQSFPITTSPQTVTLTGLTANGSAVDVTAEFSDNGSCITTFTNLYTAPADCGPQDCENSILVCSDNTFNGTAIDGGDDLEINGTNNECNMVDENQSTWFYVNIGSSGTLEMTIDPTNGTDDYDWAIWGPFTSATAAANCPPISRPIRCNTSANTAATGMSTAATNNYEYEGFSTFQWSNPINATVGDIYIMMIDNWSASGSPFTLDWGGTAGLSCNSVVLPITLMNFNGVNLGKKNKLFWTTQSEKNNDYFVIEYSPTGVNWTTVDIISGAGTSTMTQDYSTTHRDYENGINYYRLSQVDFDGVTTKHKVISIDNSGKRTLLKRINSMGQEVNENYRGLVILYYNDGSIKKVIQH